MLRITIAILAWAVYLQLLLQHFDAMSQAAHSGNGMAYAGGMVLLILGECAAAVVGTLNFGADGVWIGPVAGLIASMVLESWFRSLGWF